MVFESEHPETISSRFLSEYQNTFDELTAIFDRFQDSELDNFLEDKSELDINIKKVCKIIHSYWNISVDNTLSDFEEEISRKRTVDQEIPSVPTYQIRFALEEGSWIILLRNYFPKYIRSYFQRLLSLEDIIWNTGKAQDDDYAYYLIELNQIANSGVNILGEQFLNDHDYSKYQYFVIRLISTIFNTNIERGKELFLGSKRLLKSKTLDMSKIDNLDTSSNWAVKAKLVFADLTKDIDNEIVSIQTYNFLLSIAILQNLKTKSHTKYHASDSFELEYLISDKIGWNAVDLEDEFEREDFIDAILLVLFDRLEVHPLDAAINFLKAFFDEIKLPTHKINAFTKNLTKNVKNIEKSKLDENEKLANIVKIIEETVPQILIKIKENKFEDVESTDIEGINQDIWDSLEAQVLRVKRIQDEGTAKTTLNKAIKSNYELLINLKLIPADATITLLDKIFSFVSKEKPNIEELKSDIKEIINAVGDTYSLSIIDDKLIEYIFGIIYPLLKK